MGGKHEIFQRFLQIQLRIHKRKLKRVDWTI